MHVNKSLQATITSREIAAMAGKKHYDVLRAIREMEPAWVSLHQRKFPLMFSTRQLTNGGHRQDPYYSLSKTESLYVVSKFSDEVRARLVLRWEELERLAATPPTGALPAGGVAPRGLPGKRAHNRLTMQRLAGLLADVCRIDDRELRLSLLAKLEGKGGLS